MYKIIRLHENKAEELEIINSTNEILTFKTNKFSTYALAYIDTKNIQETLVTNSINDNKKTIIEENTTTDESEQKNDNKKQDNSQNPKTGDLIMRFVIIMIIAIVGIYIIYRLKKSYKQ